MKTQNVSLKGMKEIYECACDSWKKKIKGMTDPFSDTVLTDTQVQEMFDASSEAQTKVLKKWLKAPAKLIANIEGWQDIVDIYGEVTLPFAKPKTPEERCMNAMVMGFAIASVFNEGTKLSWEGRNQYKYVPYKYFSGDSWSPVYGCWGGHSPFPVGLAFKSSALCMKAWELFPEVYNDILMFQK